MNQPYWLKQDEKALFPDLLWARPELKSAAGKLLIVGGHAQSFAAVAEAYAAAEKAGIGSVRVLLPDCLEKTIGKLFPAAEFAPSNPSGGFAMQALAEVLAAGQWAGGTLIAGDLGRNSETTAMLENFAGKYTGQLTITKDAADFFCSQSHGIISRASTLLVLSMGQLQKLGHSLKLPSAFTSDLGTVQLVELLHDLTSMYPNLHLIIRNQNHDVVAVAGHISTTPASTDKPIWRVTTAASAATWWLQNPTKAFEAITTTLVS
ncbi:hypothetical protein IPL85_03875 [Candidatus Saccharibacteria bacterium]|nr:MAG: hypothetical protein IPL85_03875 [Candidatus Saccharibacteria bacterium]